MPNGLTDLERSVVALSRQDCAQSLMPQGVVERWLQGARATSLPLANSRLEALRRYAILLRHDGAELDPAETQRLADAGYSPAHIAEIHALLAVSPPPSLPARAKTRARSKLVLALLPFALWHSVAHAQQPPPGEGPPTEEPNDDLPGWLGWIIGPSSPGQGNQFALGAGGAYMPRYMGSKDYKFQALPAVDIKYGRFFVTFQDGIGAKFIDTENFTLGAGFTMADNYQSRDVPDGIGGLSFGVGARGFATVRQFGFEATAGVTKIIAGSTGGVVADFNLSRPIMVSERMFINPTIGARWGNAKHNNRYFGITEQQSEASGLNQFTTGSGMLDAKAEVGVQYRLTEHIGIGAVGGVTTLLGDVKNSPIVQKKTAPFAIGFISYSF